MLHHGNLFDRRLHFLRHLDDPLERRIAGHHSFEEIAKYALDLAVDQIVDFEFVETVGTLQLPRSRTTDDDLRLELRDDGMRNDLEKLSRVNGNQVLAGDF